MDSENEIEVPLLVSKSLPEEMVNIDEQAGGDMTPRFEESGNDVGVESLDYDPIFSLVFAKTTKVKHHRHVYGYTGVTLVKWSITILIGIFVGIVAYTIESCQEFIVTRKKIITQSIIVRSLLLSFIGFSAFSVFLVLVSSCLVLFWAPAAAGGGVTLVMAYLNGNDIPDFFRFSTLVTKILGTICSISSGLLVGQEGPMVHIGAAIASALTWMHDEFSVSKNGQLSDSKLFCHPTLFSFDFYNDKDRREFISAGAAAGLAAAFGAPIGGVLYALEEASSFWSRKVMWRSLLCCTFATMVLALINEWEFSASLPGSMSFHGLQPEFYVRDLPLFVVTSACAGILGAFLNTAHGWLQGFRPPSNHRFRRILEACLVVFISVIVMFTMPLLFGHCLEVPAKQSPTGKLDEAYWFKYTCPADDPVTGASYYNDLATLFFSLPRQTMQELFQLGVSPHREFTISSLGVHALSAVILFIITYGIATPGGIFMPSMLIGASFGGFMGRIFKIVLPKANIQPGLHALVGSTAMLGGVFRSSISLVVIMIEGTGGIDFMLPIIAAIVVSNWVAHHVHHTGAYEAELERQGNVHFLQSEPPHELLTITAADIMSSNVVCFHEITSVKEVIRVLRNTTHNGFPVLRRSSDSRISTGKFVGLILRHQLLVLLEREAFTEVDAASLNHPRPPKYSLYERQIPRELQELEEAMRGYHFSHHPHRRYMSSRAEAVDQTGVENVVNSYDSAAANGSDNSPENHHQQQKNVLALDLRPFMNRAPLTVRRECSAHRVYVIFRTLGLRHLCVTDSYNRLIGIITRKDIAKSQKHAQLNRFRRTFQHWDSDMRSFNQRDKERIYNLP